MLDDIFRDAAVPLAQPAAAQVQPVDHVLCFLHNALPCQTIFLSIIQEKSLLLQVQNETSCIFCAYILFSSESVLRKVQVT